MPDLVMRIGGKRAPDPVHGDFGTVWLIDGDETRTSTILRRFKALYRRENGGRGKD